MTDLDFIGIKLPLPLLNALQHKMIATGQTETEVLLAALSTYLNVQTRENNLDLETVSAKQELTIVQQEIAAMQRRLAIVEQTLSLLSSDSLSESQPVLGGESILAVHSSAVHGSADDSSADDSSADDISVEREERDTWVKAIASTPSEPFEAIEDDDIEDEPDEILYGFLDPEDR